VRRYACNRKDTTEKKENMSGNDLNLSVCIMAGGVGERFWPLSRPSSPKQLLNIIGENPMITDTADRNVLAVPPDRLYVITTRAQADAIAGALPDVPRENIIGEPYGRNTAPCIGLMSALLSARDPDTVMAVIPADHCIPDKEIYARTITDAAVIARGEHALVTIGIMPRYPETGYGYIVAGDALQSDSETVFSRVDRFVEKPPRQHAEELIADGNAFWNAGMFVFRVADMLEAFRKYLPELYPGLEEIRNAAGSDNCTVVIERVYDTAPSISIDYAIMEKADNVIVAHGAFTWDDVGSWTAAAEHWPNDENGNAVRGEALLLDTEHCVAGNYAEGIIGMIGVKDLIVVRTGDALLVCPRDRAQDVKKLVQKMKSDTGWSRYVT
jgi:mannose-1-phosphate guanylyltransferase